MNIYVYDDYLEKSKYTRIINKIEIRLTDLGLNGRIIRLNSIKNIDQAIKNEIQLGASTIVAVGNNETVNKLIGVIINSNVYNSLKNNILLGIIPIGNNNSIAHSFGINNEEEACNILLARRIQNIDIGVIDKYYFLNHISIESSETKLDIDNYSLETKEKGIIQIINLLSDPKENIDVNPHDNLLDIYIKTRKNDKTHLKANKILVHNNKHKINIDDTIEIDTPTEISVIKNKLNVIVGKNRLFI